MCSLKIEYKFAYDGWNLIGTFSVSPLLQLSDSYLWGEDLSGSLQGAGGVGGLLVATHHFASKSYYPTYDGNGNVMAYVDSSTGAKAAEYEYDPFGRTISKSGAKAGDFVYRFSTKPLDAVTGYYYFGYRHYIPELGMWANRDPIGERGGLNLYSTQNDIINIIDILGLKVTWRLASYDATAQTKPLSALIEITGVEGIRIYEKRHDGSKEPWSQGSFHPDVRFDDSDCRANFVMYIEAEGTPEALYKKGTIVWYLEHYNGGSYLDPNFSSGGKGNEPIEAVISHERGHADAFMQHVIKKVNVYMNQNFKGKGILKYTPEHKESIKKKFWDIEKEIEHKKLSAKLANEGTRNYMNKSTEFKNTVARSLIFPPAAPDLPSTTQNVTDMWIKE